METTLSRILIVGSGSIGKRHLANIKKLYPTVSLAILRHKKNFKKSNCLDVDFFYYSIDDAIKFRPQAAIIANPATEHINIAMPLAEVGVHLLIEKPLSTSTLRIDALKKLCTLNNVILMIGYNLRFQPSLEAFRKFIIEEKIGKNFSIRAEVGQYLPSWRNNSNYKKSVSAQKRLGGGVLFELSHEIDYLLWCFGPIQWVKADISKQSNLKIDVEDLACIIIGFENNSDHLIASLNMDLFRHDTTRSCTVIGEKGSLRWDGIKNVVQLFKKNGSKWVTIYQDTSTKNYTYEMELMHFINCVENKVKPLISIEEGKAVINIIDAISESSNNDKLVNLKKLTNNIR